MSTLLLNFSKWRQDDPRINAFLKKHASPFIASMKGNGCLKSCVRGGKTLLPILRDLKRRRFIDHIVNKRNILDDSLPKFFPQHMLGSPFITKLSGDSEGSGIFGTLFGQYAKGVHHWVKGWHKEDSANNAELRRLKRKIAEQKRAKQQQQQQQEQGSGRVGQYLVDALAGPLGWIRMGVRRKKEKEIRKLKREAGELPTTNFLPPLNK